MIKLEPINLKYKINEKETFKEYYLKIVNQFIESTKIEKKIFDNVIKSLTKEYLDKECSINDFFLLSFDEIRHISIEINNNETRYKELISPLFEESKLIWTKKIINEKKIKECLEKNTILNTEERKTKIKKSEKIITFNEKKLELNIDEFLIKNAAKFYTKLREYDNKRKEYKFSYHLVRALDVTVCPYCNRNYINTGKDGHDYIVGAELDHFFSKKQFHLFCISINNFVPVCSKCNGLKSDSFFKYSPFMVDDDTPSFSLVRDGVKSGFIINSKDLDYNDLVEKLKLKSAYSIHQKEIQDIDNRAIIYSRDKIKEITEVLGIIYTEEVYFDLVFGRDYTQNFCEVPLSKLKKDIIDELFEDYSIGKNKI